MIEIQEDIWSFKEYKCIPTNGTLNKQGKLVMGAGLANQARLLHINLPAKIGDYIRLYGHRAFICPEETIIIFPTKYHYRDNSDIALIRDSCHQTVGIANKYKLDKIYLPKVGCGFGGLKWDFVKREIETILDDRFIVCSYAN